MGIYTNEEYYEAILQLRPYNKEIYDFVINEVSKDNKVFIAQGERKKYGIDLRLTSSKFVDLLGRKLKKKFGGKIIRSRKLYGYSKRKRKIVYRLTVCYRLEE